MPPRFATSALSLLLATALALAPTRAAFAGSAPDDGTITVWTKDGGMFRGEVVEREPGDHILIKLADGRTKRIEWKDVERDSIGTPPLPATPRAEREAAPSPAPVGVRVHLRGDPTLRLMRETGVGTVVGSSGGRSFSGTVVHQDVLCYAPCDVVVPAGGGYHVVGEGRRMSGAFVLDGASRTIDAKLGSIGGYWAGYVSLGAGLGAALSGVLLLAIMPSHELSTYDSKTFQEIPGGPRSRTLEYSFIGVGVVLTVIGIVALAANGNEVRVDDTELARTRPRSSFALTSNGFVF